MKRDEPQTRIARARHVAGTIRLNRLFGFEPAKAPFVPQTGRRVGTSRGERLMWRDFLDGIKPRRAKARLRRKLARASRRRNFA